MGPEFGRTPLDPNQHDRGESKKNTTTQDALEYLGKVKKAFDRTPDLYGKFLEIMKDFKSSKIRVHEVKDKVANLFYGHDDLLLGFNMFLPEEHAITIPVHNPVPPPGQQPVQIDDAMEFVNRIKTRFVDEPSVYSSFLKILNLYKTNHRSCQEIYREVLPLFKDHPDLLSGFKRFLPENNNVPGWQPGPEAVRQEDWCSTMTSLKTSRPVKNERASKESKGSVHSECEERESDADTNKKMRENGSQSNPHRTSSDEDKEALNDETIFEFFKRVRERVEPDAYKEFLKCVDLRRVGALTKESLEMLACDLFEDYPDLLDGFKEIILAHGGKDGAGLLKGEDEEVREEEKREKERERSERRTRTPPLLAREKFNLCKPVSELDLSDCKQCTPSYRLLPKHYPVPPSTHRTELGKSVLNDTWVSVTSGSEDYSFKHMRKNQYEESLFRCEDDRFELDMLVEAAKSAAKRVEKLMKKINEGSIDLDEPIEIDDYLTPMNVRCIEKLYGDHGLDAMDVLRRRPEAALPVLLSRLKQKMEEWDQCRIDFNKVWSDVYAKNYHKSLDHRSFYFKQQDMKNLSSKALQVEINEQHVKNIGEDSNLLEIGAKVSMSGTPDMQFDFLDSDLHEDLYQVIKYSCNEVFSVDQSCQVLHLWVFFLEQFLGVANQQHESEVTSKNRSGKACIVHVGEIAGSGAVADESSKTASPGATDAVGPASSAQRKVAGVNGGPLCKSGATVEAVARHLTSAPSQDGMKRPCRSSSPKVEREEEREEGEILPEPGDSDEENSLSSGARIGVERGAETSGSSEKEGELDHQERMESEGEADTSDITNSPSSHGFTTTAGPLAKHWTGPFVAKENRVFYGDAHFYVLFRLYQIFYERMLSAKNYSIDEEKRRITSKGLSNSPDLYSRFKRALYNLLDGSSVSAKFEDECLALSGTHSYVLFTLDKLIFKIVKQLQVITSDEMSKKLLQLYYYEKSRTHGRIVDHVYYENAHVIAHDGPLYRLESGSNLTRLTIQLMDVVPSNSKPATSKNPKFGGDQSEDNLMIEEEETEIGGVYLKRCKRKRNSLNDTVLDGIRVHNGLECKVSGTTSKAVYVLHTEDFMFRKCKRWRHSENEMS